MDDKDKQKKRALQYVMYHLQEVNALDGENEFIHMSKAQHYLNAEISRHQQNPLEAEHLKLFQGLIEKFNDKEVRKMPSEWMIRLGMGDDLKMWYVNHPEDHWQAPPPKTPRMPSGKVAKEK